MMNNNGKTDLGPPFAVIGTGFMILPRDGIIEMLEKNALMQTKGNLLMGPLFRRIADSFRDWSRVAEPGGRFQAPEIHLIVIRLSAFIPTAVFLTEEAHKQMEAAQPEPPPSDRLKIALE